MRLDVHLYLAGTKMCLICGRHVPEAQDIHVRTDEVLLEVTGGAMYAYSQNHYYAVQKYVDL